jgi:1,4-alpha-glucan branching enzyme
MALVWSDAGYPAHGHYRDYHRHTVHHHQPWANDGDAYDYERALALAQEHAVDFVSRTKERLRRDGEGLPGGGLAVCALDTELLGHWWYEGLTWLGAVVEECARQELELVRLDDALERHEPAPLKDVSSAGDEGAPLEATQTWEASTPKSTQARKMSALESTQAGRESTLEPSRAWKANTLEPTQAWEASTWGQDGDLSTWSGPAVAEIAFVTRAKELDVVRAGPRAGPAAVRELLALQASDWAFMVARGLAAPYAHERFEGHRVGVERALAAGADADVSALRNLAVHADCAALLAP